MTNSTSLFDGKTLEYYLSLMKITSKGQVTIPQEFRERFRLHPNTEVEFFAGEHGVVIRPMRTPQRQFREWLDQARGSATKKISTDEVMKLTRGEE